MTAPLPPPFGKPAGPERASDDLLRAYLGGESSGHSDDFRIEDAMLVADGRALLAIRLGGPGQAVLVRSDLPAGVEVLRDALEATLAEAGIGLVEADTVLGGVVGIEIGGVRGAVWDLWARGAEQARETLRLRALGEIADAVDPGVLAEREQLDATLAELERGLDEPGQERP